MRKLKSYTGPETDAPTGVPANAQGTLVRGSRRLFSSRAQAPTQRSGSRLSEVRAEGVPRLLKVVGSPRTEITRLQPFLSVIQTRLKWRSPEDKDSSEKR